MSGFTPCLVTQLPNGQQQFQPLQRTESNPFMVPTTAAPLPTPMFVPVFLPSLSPICNFLPSISPMAASPVVSPYASPSNSPVMLPLPNPFVCDPQNVRTWNTGIEAKANSDDLYKIKLNDASIRCDDYIDESGSSRPVSHSRSVSPASLPRSDSEFSIERPLENEPRMPVLNEKNIALPVITAEMTKKDLVNMTLDYLYEIFGNNFDTEGNRGANVLRVKVKTRGALEHICILIEKCISEGLLCQISCPISTKKARQHIRGYLAYIEAVNGEAADRVAEIFEEYNNSILVRDSNTNALVHPFKGISRNPVTVRAKKN